jgi:hypothetical protein
LHAVGDLEVRSYHKRSTREFVGIVKVLKTPPFLVQFHIALPPVGAHRISDFVYMIVEAIIGVYR